MASGRTESRALEAELTSSARSPLPGDLHPFIAAHPGSTGTIADRSRIAQFLPTDP